MRDSNIHTQQKQSPITTPIPENRITYFSQENVYLKLNMPINSRKYVINQALNSWEHFSKSNDLVKYNKTLFKKYHSKTKTALTKLQQKSKLSPTY